VRDVALDEPVELVFGVELDREDVVDGLRDVELEEAPVRVCAKVVLVPLLNAFRRLPNGQQEALVRLQKVDD